MPEGSEAKEKRAIVLLSGGLDSATTLAIARSEGYAITAISFRYGQRHVHELRAAAAVAEAAGVTDHLICDIDLRAFGGSALTDDALDVPHGRSDDAMAAGIPITYVPARNTIFLSFALGLAEVRGARDIFIGVNAVDYSGYPDCRPEFVEAFERTANRATRAGVESAAPWFRIRAPLIDLTKADIIRKGLALGVDYGRTHSCYDPSPAGEACGDCDSCTIRLRAFATLGVEDPAPYVR
jgi:7-cyano-7-deazaguanine synthase